MYLIISTFSYFYLKFMLVLPFLPFFVYSNIYLDSSETGWLSINSLQRSSDFLYIRQAALFNSCSSLHFLTQWYGFFDRFGPQIIPELLLIYSDSLTTTAVSVAT